MLLKVPAVFPLVAELTLALDTASENLLFLTPVFCCAELVNIEVVMLVGIAPLTLVLVLFAELLSDALLKNCWSSILVDWFVSKSFNAGVLS